MRAPRLVRGGIRNNFEFYPLREEEELILGLLQSKLIATTEDILLLIGREDLSNSQNNKRKADAINEINKLMKKLVGKTIIKSRKDPSDKRQVIYFYNRNLLN
jgi:DNA-binding MarR family transcriptional regulator